MITAYETMYQFETLEAAALCIRGGFLMPEDEAAVFNVQNHLIFGTFDPDRCKPLEFQIAKAAIETIMHETPSAVHDDRLAILAEKMGAQSAEFM